MIIKRCYKNSVRILIFIFLFNVFINSVNAHTLSEVYIAALFGVQNSNYSQFDNIVILIKGIIGFTDFIFLSVIAVSFLLYFYGIKKLHKKGMHSGASKLSFIVAFAFIVMYFFGFVIHQATASSLTFPLGGGGQAFLIGDSKTITWDLDGAAHIDLHYTTTGVQCPSNNGGNSCGTESGFTCINHPQTGSSRAWTIPDVSSTTVKIRLEGHTGGPWCERFSIMLR